MPRFNRINGRTIMIFRSLRELTAREKQHLRSEIVQVKGLMPLLMKIGAVMRCAGSSRALSDAGAVS